MDQKPAFSTPPPPKKSPHHERGYLLPYPRCPLHNLIINKGLPPPPLVLQLLYILGGKYPTKHCTLTA